MDKKLEHQINGLLERHGLPRTTEARKINPAMVTILKASRANPELALKLVVACTITMGIDQEIQDAKGKLSDEKRRELLSRCSEMLYYGRPTMREASKTIKKIFPQRGGPGRKEILTFDQKRHICNQISDEELHGRSHAEAIAFVTEHIAELIGKKVSERTIARTWEQRAKIL
jgi:hypothetical protein